MNRPSSVRALWNNRRVAELEVMSPVWASKLIGWRWHFGRHRPHRRWRPTSKKLPKRGRRRSSLALYVTVLLPFAAGYTLAWIYYAINALIADTLAKELALGPADLGFLTAIYLLGMAIAQFPLGSLVDRYGPRWVQSACLLVAALGAAVFATAGALPVLLAGRLLIGIGVATAFTAGVSAIAFWFPKDRPAFATGLLSAIGSLGAITATIPAQMLVDAFGWRALFGLLALLSVMCAVLIFLLVPQPVLERDDAKITDVATFTSILADDRFWRLALASSLCVGTAWSLEGL